MFSATGSRSSWSPASGSGPASSPSGSSRTASPLAGTWFDRTQEYLARRKGEDADRLRYATPETVIFSPLPCWKNLSPEAYRQRVANMAAEIEEDAAAAGKRTGAEPVGVAAILAQVPTNRPKRLKKSPAPPFHAASQAMRHYFYEGFSWFAQRQLVLCTDDNYSCAS